MATREEPILRLVGLAKHFGPLKAVDDITLDIHDGEFFTVVGPSGSGKTTLLRMLTGMEHPTAGDIFLRGERVNDVPANRRPTCMVFQSLAPFAKYVVQSLGGCGGLDDVWLNNETTTCTHGIDPS